MMVGPDDDVIGVALRVELLERAPAQSGAGA